MRSRFPSGRLGPVLSFALLIALLIAVSVAAHAALDVPTPAEGGTVEGTPTEVAGTFTQTLEKGGSSLQLRNAAGEIVATGGVDPADGRRMVITALPELEPGDYEVRWTTLSAEDGELERDTWTFTVVAAATQTAELTAEPTAAASAAAPSSPDVDDSSPSSTDVLLPIVAGLAFVLIAAGLFLRRRGRSGPTS